MKRTILIALALFSMNGVMAQKTKAVKDKTKKQIMESSIMPTNIHGFAVKDINGREFEFSSLKGKKVMIVNTASRCGLTPQYEKLEALYKEYGGDKFVIIGFPANNFMGQEPGTEPEIAEFCQKNYGVTFPMMSKISVKGEDMHPLYVWLTNKKYNGVEDNEISWNFEKILINEKGEYVRSVEPRTQPDDASIIEWIKGK